MLIGIGTVGVIDEVNLDISGDVNQAFINQRFVG